MTKSKQPIGYMCILKMHTHGYSNAILQFLSSKNKRPYAIVKMRAVSKPLSMCRARSMCKRCSFSPAGII